MLGKHQAYHHHSYALIFTWRMTRLVTTSTNLLCPTIIIKYQNTDTAVVSCICSKVRNVVCYDSLLLLHVDVECWGQDDWVVWCEGEEKLHLCLALSRHRQWYFRLLFYFGNKLELLPTQFIAKTNTRYCVFFHSNNKWKQLHWSTLMVFLVLGFDALALRRERP